jgi:hypothetical protein
MSFIKTTFAALAVASHFTSVLAAPTDREGLTLSIRAADIIKNDLSATEDHPLMELYTRWLNTSPHAEFIRRNASSIVERCPTFSSVDCYEHTWDQASCLQALACSAWLLNYLSKLSRSLHFCKQVKRR